MSRERWFKHGKLKERVLSFWASCIPRLYPTDAIHSIRQVASRYGMQCQTRPSTVEGSHWVFLRPKPARKP